MFVFTTPQNGVLDATRKVGNYTLTLRAKNMRMNRDGYVRALLAMIVNTTAIHSTPVDIEDDSERHNFANRLYGTAKTGGKFGTDIASAFPQADFEQELLVWSRAAWNAYIGASSGEFVKGDENRTAPPWVIPTLVMEGSTSIWAGDAGANKSTLMRMACQSITYGKKDVIDVRREGMCIWVNAEESPEEHTRQLGNVNEALSLKRTKEMFTIHARGMRVDDLATRLEKAVRENDAKHVFIDSLSRLAQGMSLNDNNTATLLVDTIAGAAPKASVNWIGHTGWGNRERLAGSRHFENAARVMVLVQSRLSIISSHDVPERGVRARLTKANGAVASETPYWHLTYDRSTGLNRAERSSEDQWPSYPCDYPVGETGKEPRNCGRLTWDGVMADFSVRCSRHRGEETEA